MKLAAVVALISLAGGAAACPRELEAQNLTPEDVEEILIRAVMLMLEEFEHWNYSDPALLFVDIAEDVEIGGAPVWTDLGQEVAEATGVPLWDGATVCRDESLRMRHNDFGLGPTLRSFSNDTARVSVVIGPILNHEAGRLLDFVRAGADWRAVWPDIGTIHAVGEPCDSIADGAPPHGA